MNFGQKFVLTNDVMYDILERVREKPKVFLTTVCDFAMGDELEAYLADNGINLERHDKTGMLTRQPPHQKPLEIRFGPDFASITLDPA